MNGLPVLFIQFSLIECIRVDKSRIIHSLKKFSLWHYLIDCFVIENRSTKLMKIIKDLYNTITIELFNS